MLCEPLVLTPTPSSYILLKTNVGSVSCSHRVAALYSGRQRRIVIAILTISLLAVNSITVVCQPCSNYFDDMYTF